MIEQARAQRPEDDDLRPSRSPATEAHGDGSRLAGAGDARLAAGEAGELREQGLYLLPIAAHRLAVAAFVGGTGLEAFCLYCPGWSACGTNADCLSAFAQHTSTLAHAAARSRATTPAG